MPSQSRDSAPAPAGTGAEAAADLLPPPECPAHNQAEQSLHRVVIMDKEGARSEKRLENHTVLRSLFETARRHGKKVHEFFCHLFIEETAQAQASL